MIKNLFLQIFNMSITASVVILRVIILRYLFRKQPKIYSYVLWALVIFRLLCPYSISFNTSLFNILPANYSADGKIHYLMLPQPENEKIFSEENTYKPAVDDKYISENNEIVSNEAVINQNTEAPDNKAYVTKAETVNTFDFASAASVIWITGVIYILCRNILSMLQLKKQLAGSRHFFGNVMLCSNISTAFITGIIKPVIYLPENLNEDEINHVLIHEETHISRGDYFFKLIGFIALCLHWFNPLVWLAFSLAEKDMEMSCDEAVIKKLGRNKRQDYSQTLLSISAPHNKNQLHLAFGEGDTKSRILNILDYKQPAFRYIIGICLIIIISAVMLIFNPTGLNAAKSADVNGENITAAYAVNDTRHISLPVSSNNLISDILKTVSVSPLENTFIHENGKHFFFIRTDEKEVTVNFSDDFTQMWITGDNIENTGAVYAVKNPDKISGFFKGNFDERNTMNEKISVVFPAVSFESDVQSYLVNMNLSDWWYISSKTYDNRGFTLLADSSSHSAYIINNAKETVGTVLFGSYDPQNTTPDDIYKEISNRNGYKYFDEDSTISDHIFAGDTETIYHDISDDHEMAEQFYPLVLCCSEEHKVFAALSFFPDMITDEQIDAIAASLSISPTENIHQEAVVQLGSFWLKPDEPDRIIAETAAKIHLRDNLKVKNYTINNISIYSPLYSSVAEFEYPKEIFTDYMYVVQVKYAIDYNSLTSLIYIRTTDNCNYDIIGSVEDSMIMEPVHISSTYTQTKERIVRIPPESQAVKDNTLKLGETKIISEGEYGIALENAAVTYSKGIVVEEKVQQLKLLRESKPQITAVGTLWNGQIIGSTGKLIWPVSNGRISRGFTGQYPYNHNGIDIAAPTGTHIYAAADGVVTKALYTNVGYGIYCEIDHGDFKTLYGQCSSLDVVTGQKVQQGQLIGAVGSTGNSTGPHLHFEVKQGNESIDPYNYF